jgi:uncharacterized membrane protein YozB (DUF420 family)
MDAKVLYWSGALLNMAVIAGLAVHGIRCVRRGETARHARAMRAAAALVGLFLLSYVLKLAFLGREALAAWSSLAVNVLRFHELCVLVMLIGGGTALVIGRRLRASRSFTHSAGDPPAPPALLRRHRLAGRVALAGAILGAATAGLVLAGMYARAGLLDAPALAGRLDGPALARADAPPAAP